MVRLYNSYYAFIYTCIVHTVFTCSSKMKWARQTATCARPFRNLLKSIFIQWKVLNEIGDGELATSSGSEFQMPTHRQANMLGKLLFLTMGITSLKWFPLVGYGLSENSKKSSHWIRTNPRIQFCITLINQTSIIAIQGIQYRHLPDVRDRTNFSKPEFF